MLEKRSRLMFGLAVVSACMLSACGQPEHPRTVSDFCLVDKELSVSVAPAPDVNDVGNKYDSDQTVNEIFEHNLVHGTLCPTTAPSS